MVDVPAPNILLLLPTTPTSLASLKVLKNVLQEGLKKASSLLQACLKHLANLDQNFATRLGLSTGTGQPGGFPGRVGPGTGTGSKFSGPETRGYTAGFGKVDPIKSDNP
ncbi:hypothetical protein C8J57DRAFT_1251120 [Mycena rebaudengoi]|nr:hypothetical protein C8J57DRAFT_1251120 [Mycena rebaudengoi]